jgi:hypothetical protein
VAGGDGAGGRSATTVRKDNPHGHRPRPGPWPGGFGPDEIKQLWAGRATLTDPFNLSGNPAISLPLGWSSAGLPIGVQLVGRWAAESTLLACAERFEQSPAVGRPPPPVATIAALSW